VGGTNGTTGEYAGFNLATNNDGLHKMDYGFTYHNPTGDNNDGFYYSNVQTGNWTYVGDKFATYDHWIIYSASGGGIEFRIPWSDIGDKPVDPGGVMMWVTNSGGGEIFSVVPTINPTGAGEKNASHLYSFLNSNSGLNPAAGGSVEPLPVEVVNLSTLVTLSSVELRWSTSTEMNNFGFEIERREIADLRLQISDLRLESADWKTIGFVKGAGTTTSPSEYSYTDDPPSAGRYAYRLKQIERNGAFKYYGSVEIEIVAAPMKLALSENYPNPFNPSTTIRFSVPEDGQAVLKVFNVAGQEVGRLFDGIATAGKYYEVMFNASRLSSGVYFYAIQYGNQRLMKKMMLIK
jgi:hypothetical protein